MFFKDLFSAILILFLFNLHLTTGENSTSTDETLTVNTTLSTTNTSMVVSCPEGYKQLPSCLECETDYERKGDTCVLITKKEKPSRGTARRLFLLFLGCLLTTFLIIAMIVTYNRVSDRRRGHTQPPTNSNLNGRFQNILQSIGLNNLSKRTRFPFFSISNNNHPDGHHRQAEASRAPLSENQDEALLFDDPYADGGMHGGIHGSSANPYKSLTLSVA